MGARNQKGAQSTGGKQGNGVKAVTGSTSATRVGTGKSKPARAAGGAGR